MIFIRLKMFLMKNWCIYITYDYGQLHYILAPHSGIKYNITYGHQSDVHDHILAAARALCIISIFVLGYITLGRELLDRKPLGRIPIDRKVQKLWKIWLKWYQTLPLTLTGYRSNVLTHSYLQTAFFHSFPSKMLLALWGAAMCY